MDLSANTQARLERAKARLYVLCQGGGWLFFLVLQLVVIASFRDPNPTSKATTTDIILSLVRVFAEGFLITHYARIYLTRWGWKELGWRPLVPRILGMALLMSGLWTIVGYGIDLMLLRIEISTKHPLWLMCLTSTINGTILMTGWLCLYFFYHLFERLNRLQVEQLQLVATAKEAELRALTAMEERLDPRHFFRANRKQVINLAWVDGIEPWFSGGLLVKLKGGMKVELSRRQAQDFRDRMSL